MSKRPGSPLSGPPAKKSVPVVPAINIGSVSGQEELEVKVLSAQNKLLSASLRRRKEEEEALRSRVSSLEEEHKKAEGAVSTLMSHWNRFEEQLQTMLFQCGAVRTLGKQPECASQPVRTLIKTLSNVGEDSSPHLRDRCQFTVSSTRELTVTLDRLYQRVSEECTDVDLGKENERLHELVNTLRGQVCEAGQSRDKIANLREEVEKLTSEVAERQHDLDQAQRRVEKLKSRLQETQQNLSTSEHQQTSGASGQQAKSEPQDTTAMTTHMTAPLSDSSVSEELREQRELAVSRMKEIEAVQSRLQDAVRSLELAKASAHEVSDMAITQSPLFLSLQSQYSTLFQERQQLKVQLDESIEQLKECKEQYNIHLDKVEADEMKYHRLAQGDISRLTDRLGETQRNLQAARMEIEQSRVASEQAGTLKELRRFAGGLQKENKQLKAELMRLKQNVEENGTMMERLRDGVPLATLEIRAIEKRVTEKPKDSQTGEAKDMDTLKEELKAAKDDLKKAQEAEKESIMLLDAYKSLSKEQREKAEVMANEARQKTELDEVRQRLEAQQNRLVRDCLNDSEASLRWKEAQDTIHQLHTALNASRRNHDALLSEMDVTGEAFEDMQEQNARLLSQLQEKDDANFKLMSERISANTLHSLLREEKQAIEGHTQVLQNQIATQSELIQRLHEKERLLHLDLSSREEEISRRQAQADSLKRKALECAQSAQDRKTQAEKSSGEVRDLRQRVADQQVGFEQEQHRARRLKEEVTSLQQQVERGNQSDFMASADEILQEEVKIYKSKLTCPCCNSNKKDCILIKCFHVFCHDCVQKRYDTRQRKCPKCNAGFGANDFHRIYL